MNTSTKEPCITRLLRLQPEEQTGENDRGILTSLRVGGIARVAAVGVRRATAAGTQSPCRRRRNTGRRQV